MSDPLIASSSKSTYSNSIKFYDQVSHLQEELKTYESQHFNLEEEFQRLWTQGTSVPLSNGGVQPKHTTFTEQSQLLANPTNSNLPNYRDQECRRARNTAILDKLQELETNAAIFAARSERLRMMRNEYKDLVRKYSTNRNRKQTEASQKNVNQQKNEHPINLTSTSVNTDISGPVIAVTPPTILLTREKTSSLNIDIPPEETQITAPAVRTHSSISQQLSPHPDGHGFIAISDPYLDSNLNFLQSTNPPGTILPSFSIPIRKKSTLFLDLSSTTTESEDWDSKRMEHRRHNYPEQVDRINYDEEDDDETTSLSGVLSKHHSSNYNQNISTDASLSETTSTNQLQRHAINKKILRMGDDGNGDTAKSTKVGENKTTTTTNSMGKTFMISSASVDERVESHPEEKSGPPERDDLADRDDSSGGDSLMDSICNKTPDSLPRDDSELLHITEGDENEEVDAERDWEDGGKKLLPDNETLIAEKVPREASPLGNRNGDLLPLKLEETQVQSSPQCQRPIVSPPPPNVVAVATKDAPQNFVPPPPTFSNDSEDKEIMSTASFVGVYTTSEQEVDEEGSRGFEFNGSDRNKGVVINSDGLGGVGNEFREKGPEEGSGTRNKSEGKKMDAQGSSVKFRMKNEKQRKPSARKKLKMDYDDSESEEGSEKNGNTATQDLNPSLHTALKQDKVPTKEELDAEFEDFFG